MDEREIERQKGALKKTVTVSSAIQGAMIVINFLLIVLRIVPFMGVLFLPLYVFVYVKFLTAANELKSLGIKSRLLSAWKIASLLLYIASVVLCSLQIG